MLDLKPGDEFEIKLGRKQIKLIPLGSSEEEWAAGASELGLGTGMSACIPLPGCSRYWGYPGFVDRSIGVTP